MPGKLTHKEMKFVSKDWGHEIWIVNNNKYCGKILFLRKGQHCSFHFHKIKDEVLYVQSGKIAFIYKNDEDSDRAYEVLNAGDAWHVVPGVLHQMIALEDTHIHEFSTQHFDEDSHRVSRDAQAVIYGIPPVNIVLV